MTFPEIHSCPELIDLVRQVGFLPLLDSGVAGYSAEDIVDEDCRYTKSPDGGWEWPLWKWKGQVVSEGGCMYGKFFDRKAGFVSWAWWPHLCNYRRSKYPLPEEGSIEAAILDTLRTGGSQITRELRAACGFEGKGMRSKFDAYITRLQMATYIVTEDFVYPVDRHNREYGWGWSLLSTPEELYGREVCLAHCSPEESRRRIEDHLRELLPGANERQILRLVG